MKDETLKASAFWRRLDTSGTDVARLFRTKAGWRLAGTAVFLHEKTKAPSRLDYELKLRSDWATSCGFVRGFVGRNVIDQTFRRDIAGWHMNGRRVRGLEGVVDLDFGFTPATNFAQVQRIHLAVGAAADFSVAWWDAGERALVNLPQHYERRSERKYWYESPSGPYEAELEFAASGFARHYPQLWALESD